MDQDHPPQRVYHAHRGRQHRLILDVARRLFDQQGIDRVTMAQIISASGLMRSTIYQYFANKDEIIWAIVQDIFEQSNTSYRPPLEGIHGPALTRIAALLELLADELVTKPEQVRFMAQFDALYARDWSAEQMLTLQAQVLPADLGTILTTLVRDGIADGSLRPDLVPELTMHSILNAAIGTQRRLASLGERIEVEYGQPVDQLFRETIRVILLGLQAP
jgi:AcrR family transcriptional regulator